LHGDAVVEEMERLGQALLALEPQFRERAWGGRRLHPANPPIGEAWVAFGASRVTNGSIAGRSVDAVAAAFAAELLGEPVARRLGARFPLILKLLDCAEWLSIQVHPDDAQAAAMLGPGTNGKTEAWFFVETPPGARILVGVKPGVDASALAAAIRGGHVLDVMAEVPVANGDTQRVPAGTLHSLGPGLLVYEIQQASDTTFRAFDWDRPSSAGRKLHVEECVAVARAVGPEPSRHPEVRGATGVAPAVVSPYFELELARAGGTPLSGDTRGDSFHAITVLEGRARVVHGPETLVLGPLQTGLVAAAAGPYEVRAADGPVTLLRAWVPAAGAL
jgi:mannose-6-phosphate isomerase